MKSTPGIEDTPSIEATPELPPTNTPLPEGEAEANSGSLTDDNPTTPSYPHAAERAEIESAVASIRGLQPITSVVPSYLSMEEVRQRLESDLLEDYGPDEARIEAISLSAFDFVPADFDLHSFLLDLLTEQVAGFYDPETNEFVVRSDDEEFDSLEQIAHAHEFVHALQDQYFDLEMLNDDSLTSEEAFAIQAFVEGEATFVQMLFLQSDYFSFEELTQLMMEVVGSLTADMDVLESAPPVLASELEFPYIAGLEFIQALYNEGGFEAVDNAWQTLPQSTEQIIHPERYFARDEPETVSLVPVDDLVGDAWEKIDENSLGEFFLREYLTLHLDSSLVNRAATGWGGDSYTVFYNDDTQDVLYIQRISWDTPSDNNEFQDAFTIFGDRRFGFAGEPGAGGGHCWVGEDTICTTTIGDDSLIVRAPDLATAEVLLNSQLP